MVKNCALPLYISSMKDQSFYSLACRRRSIRKYTDEPISPKDVQLLLASALRAPSSRNRHSPQYIVVEDREMLSKMSVVREKGAAFLREAPIAIVVLGDPSCSAHWFEDAVLAASYIQLQAEDLGLGSCWCQIVDTLTVNGQESAEYIRLLLGIPLQLQVLAIIAIGHKGEDKEPRPESELLWERVHIGAYMDSKEEDHEPA